MAKDKKKPTTPQNLSALALNSTTVNLGWLASTDPVSPGQPTSGVTGYRIFRNGVQIVQTATPVLNWSDTAATPGASYSYTVAAVDNAGNQSNQSTPAAVTMPGGEPVPPDGPDITAPSVPQNLSAVAQGETQINLTWSSSTDPTVSGQEHSGLAGYKIYRDSAFLASVLLVNSFQDTGLTADTEYSYTVSAIDLAGNESAQSAADTATTHAAGLDPDTTAPTLPTGLAATTQSSSAILVSWSASTDPNVGGQVQSGLAGYRLYRGGSLIASPALVTSYQDTGLSAGTQYTYTLKSRDNAGNESAETSGVSATTTSTGNVVNAASASRTDVVAAIAAASTGDTVRLPSGQSATWTAQVALAKAITLDFNGCTITRSMPSTNQTMLLCTVPSGGGTLRVANGTFSGGSSSTGFNGVYLQFAGGAAGYFRLDHCTFNDAGGQVFIDFKSGQKGLVDHCTFHGGSSVNEILHNVAYGSGSTTGWTNAVVPGSDDAVYVEDCSFTSTRVDYAAANSAMQNYYGARTVFRHNTIEDANFDNHGTAGSVGGRWYEVYDNTWLVSINLSKCLQLRAGSGVVFNNVCQNNSGAAGARTLELWEEDGGAYPVLYQVGRGQNQGSDPLYIWNNTNTNNGGGTGGMAIGVQAQNSTNGQGEMIQASRDYLTTTKPGYTAFTYPHPLQST